jgi:hypothetical protein
MLTAREWVEMEEGLAIVEEDVSVLKAQIDQMPDEPMRDKAREELEKVRAMLKKAYAALCEAASSVVWPFMGAWLLPVA